MIPHRITNAFTRRIINCAIAITAGLVLGGCASNIKRDLGILKTHPDWRHRMLAAERLAWRGSPDVAPALIDSMKSDEELFVRNTAAQGLARLKDPRAVEPLISTMLQDIAVREEATKALAAIDGPTVEARLKSLARDKDPITREYSMEGLALLNTDGHLTDFIEETMADPSPSVRRQAVRALRATSHPGSKPADPLVRFLLSYDEVTRAHAAEDMGLTQDGLYVPLLVEAAAGDRSESVRRAACGALGRIGSDEATDALIRLLDDRWAPVEAVLRGLAQTGRDRAVEPIIALYDREGFPRTEAVRALKELDGPRVTEFFQERLLTERGAVRRAIIDAMAEMRDRAAAQALIATFVSDPASQVRVVRVLEKIGGEEVIQFLARAAVDPEVNPAARRAAVQALKQEGGDATAELLREAALSQRPSVARAAREAMKALRLTPPLKPPDLEELRPLQFRPPPPR
ncbi:MAG: HEAT repeat domain-containing protein [Nitrospinae bacterium]|nr:HEAT repeat domain-containing protein [Nitrospinota bacterium]